MWTQRGSWCYSCQCCCKHPLKMLMSMVVASKMCSRIRIWYLRTIVCFYPCGKKAGKLSTNGRKTNTQHGQQQQQQRYQLQKNTHREQCSRRIIKMKEKRIKSERWKKKSVEFNVCAVVTNQTIFIFTCQWYF